MFEFPALRIGSCVSWGDCVAWALRRNAATLKGLDCGAAGLNVLKGLLWAECKARSVELTFASELQGHFYVIELDKARRDNRFKLGYSRNVYKRLDSFKTIAPFADLLHYWPCQPSWECAAKDCVIHEMGLCEQEGESEVVRCERIIEPVMKLNELFVLMGAVNPARIDELLDQSD